MIYGKHSTAGVLLALFVATTLPAGAAGFPHFGKNKQDTSVVSSRKLTPTENALIDKAIAREKVVIATLKQRAPLVETYLQNMKPDQVMGQVPESDQHFLGRVDFNNVIGNENYEKRSTSSGPLGFFKHSGSYITNIGANLHLNFNQTGFVQMLLIDSNNFDRQHYIFGFVRNEFLGNTPTAVFDVAPMPGTKSLGRFFGRIWIETGDGNVVRFNGDFAGTEKGYREFYHFDSWRTNVQPNLWMPTSAYVEESDSNSPSHTLKFKAINHIWGYSLKVPTQESSNTSLDVVGATDVSNDAQDVSPLGAQRAWVQQAEDNVVDRLYQAGLLDAPSDFDKTLADLANNILAYNNITLSRPIRVRTLLTQPLESLAIGNTIILSKGLIDTTGVVTQDGAQQMGNLNALLAFQVAHIILGHRLDTKYAFNDQLLFPSTSVFKRIPMHHTDADNEAAAKKAIELLNAKELVGGEQYFGLYLQQLQARLKGLPALNQPQIGDGLVKGDKDPTFWMAALMSKSPKLNMNDLKQQAAMPLSAFLRFNPWTDQVTVMHTAYEPLLSPADKMPFEVEPVYLKLTAYQEPTAAPAQAPNATAPNTAAPADNTAQPPAAAPAPAPGNAAPPAAEPQATVPQQ
ncbi:hypothetical protein [Edaphobacter dinghuensis]|uniref:Uncharacterized protein n=1 Tax=Edaphobacter dinghuensis TaxID=1560005 RepID=A0A917HLV6_9BACT|nr:hypothetical protein [Edaphobacter dinghuensis]GGG83380.1 hypothetical protein GCM10011585_28870 [Edaphobacter dinghuensis]